MSTEIARKIIEQVRANQCRKKNCVSQQRDPLDVVWFGKQYGVNREATCSACYICNDEAVKNSLPTHLNVLPLRYISLHLQFIHRAIHQRDETIPIDQSKQRLLSEGDSRERQTIFS
jgi:hypothetical protein